MSRIGCGACRDLLPLVEDGVASEESRLLVEEHLQSCESCRREAGKAAPMEEPVKNLPDSALHRLRRWLLLWGGLLVFAGCVCGILLTYSAGMFYNFLLMPAAGTVSLLLFGKKGLLAAPAVGLAAFLWMGSRTLAEGGKLSEFAANWPYAVIYALLCLLGAAVAALLRFAFRKEGRNE